MRRMDASTAQLIDVRQKRLDGRPVFGQRFPGGAQVDAHGRERLLQVVVKLPCDALAFVLLDPNLCGHQPAQVLLRTRQLGVVSLDLLFGPTPLRDVADDRSEQLLPSVLNVRDADVDGKLLAVSARANKSCPAPIERDVTPVRANPLTQSSWRAR